MSPNRNNLKYILIFIKTLGIVSFVLSMYLIPFYVDGGLIYYYEDAFVKHGFTLLIFGWVYLVNFGGIGFIWLANLLIILSIWYPNKVFKIFSGSLSFLFALSFLLFDNIITNDSRGFVLLGDRIGKIEYSDITQIGAGYWFWVFTIFLILTHHILIYRLPTPKPLTNR